MRDPDRMQENELNQTIASSDATIDTSQDAAGDSSIATAPSDAAPLASD